MTHLRIELNNIQENVSSAVILKLYELAISGDLDLNSNLAGNLHTTATYLLYIDALHTAYPDLYISATDTYMMFEDPEVENKLKNYVGDGVGVSADRFLAMTQLPNGFMSGYDWIDIFIRDKSLIKFNELALATNCTTLGNTAFETCSNLELINISNITSVGNDCFLNCRKCVFNGTLSNLQSIGSLAFLFCYELTGNLVLPHVSSMGNNAFEACKISSVNLTGSTITTIPNSAFCNISTLTTATIPTSVTEIVWRAFGDDSALTTVSGLSNVTTIGGHAFESCSNLTTVDIDWTKITNLGENVFRGCSSLGSGQTLELNLTNQTSYPNYALYGTAFTRLILHSPLLSYKYDTRYPIYENMRQLTYLDLSDWRPGMSAFNTNLYGDSGFYNNNSLVTYIAPITTNYIGTAINDMERYANARYFILLNTTPPSIQTTDQNNPPDRWFYNRNGNVHIYVPDSAVSAYLNDSAWSTIGGYNGSDTISDRLHGLSELPAGVWTTGLASQYLTAALLATS